MNMRKNKILCRYIPAQHPGMNTIFFILLLMLFSSLMPVRVDACCYPGCAYNGNFAGLCCSTADECEAPTQNGCTIEFVHYTNGDVYWIHCSGGTSQCMVIPIDCCAFGSTSICCTGGKTDPCCGNPDPCCIDPICCGDPCCGSKCCPKNIPGQAGG